MILVHTHIGYGSPKKQDNFSAHGNPLGEEELQAAKKALGWPSMDKFYLPEQAVKHFREAVDRGAKAQQEWQKRLAAYRKDFPKEAAEFEQAISGKPPDNWGADLPKWKPSDKPIATRVAGGEALNALAASPSSFDISGELARVASFGDINVYRARYRGRLSRKARHLDDE